MPLARMQILCTQGYLPPPHPRTPGSALIKLEVLKAFLTDSMKEKWNSFTSVVFLIWVKCPSPFHD